MNFLSITFKRSVVSEIPLSCSLVLVQANQVKLHHSNFAETPIPKCLTVTKSETENASWSCSFTAGKGGVYFICSIDWFHSSSIIIPPPPHHHHRRPKRTTLTKRVLLRSSCLGFLASLRFVCFFLKFSSNFASKRKVKPPAKT